MYQRTVTRNLATMFFSLFVVLSCASEKPARPEPFSGLKVVCVWSVVAETREAVDSAVARAKDLGFNGVCWRNPALVEACRKHGIKSFQFIQPLDRRPDAQLQVLEPGEETITGYRPGEITPEDFYQYGGESVPGNREILDQNLACPNDPGVIEYSMKKIAEVVDACYDGILLDFIGYRNYHSCNCELCRRGLAEFRTSNPDMSADESATMYFGNLLVDLYDTLYVRIKSLAPDLIVTNHIHPVYMPDLFYGHRISTDYCGTTVSWFFQPHWSGEKVENYIRKVLDGPYVHRNVQGMPMIGFYTDWPLARDRKDRERLKLDFELLKQAGAEHLMFCELGHIFRDPDAYDLIKSYMAEK